MAHRSHVPKFGNWQNGENDVPYTVFFDKARQGRTGGKMINPNDPQENPDMFPDAAPTGQAVPPPARARPVPDEPVGRGPAKPVHEHRVSREDADPRPFTGSPSHGDGDNASRRSASDSSTRQGQGSRSSGSARAARTSMGSDHGIDRSPLHPHYQARVAGRGGSASPGALEGRNSLDSSHGTPGRSRPRPATRAETPDRGVVVPKFGEWDEKDPASADSYTSVFTILREERHAGNSGTGTNSEPSHNNAHNDINDGESSMWCCFPRGRK